MRTLALLFALGLPLAAAQAPKADPPKPEAPEKAAKAAEERPVQTHHAWKSAKGSLAYTATAGFMPLKNDKDEVEAKVFFVAYTQDGAGPDRPLTFAFNGGPGSASIWLHMGGLGPRRPSMLPDGRLAPPPYRAEDNPASWLEFTDLVFIDPVGTGLSRAEKPELQKKFWSYKGDVESVSEFVRLYLTRQNRWNAPVFVCGESYGGTRAAALAPVLADKGVGVSGLLLISPALSFQAIRFTPGNDLPYATFLPAFAATAWYHKRLPQDLQAKPLAAVLREAEAFAEGPYLQALWQGDRLQGEAREAVVAQVARFTGLSAAYVRQADLRPAMSAFDQELLRDQGLMVGRLDGRLTAQHARGTAEYPDFDPLSTATTAPFLAAFQDHLRRELGFQTDVEYRPISLEVNRAWEWGADNRFVDASAALAEGLRKGPHTRVFVASGLYDLGTPYRATRYSLDHMGLGPGAAQRITYADYEAGHMMYIDQESLKKLQADAAAFYRRTAAQAR